MTEQQAIRLALEALEKNRRTHHYCEDTWYSCPKHEDGCANDSEGDKCNCGANEANVEIDKAITALRQALEQQQDEPAPVAKNEGGRITWMVDDWPQNCLLYTHPPKSFTYEQVKAHIRAASMSANDISVGSDTTKDGVSIVIRRRDEILYAEFFAYTRPQPAAWVGLTEQDFSAINQSCLTKLQAATSAESILKGKNT